MSANNTELTRTSLVNGGDGQWVGQRTIADVGKRQDFHRVRSVGEQVRDGGQLTVSDWMHRPQRRRKIRRQREVHLVALSTSASTQKLFYSLFLNSLQCENMLFIICLTV